MSNAEARGTARPGWAASGARATMGAMSAKSTRSKDDGAGDRGHGDAAEPAAFDARLARLEGLVAEVEGGGLGLEAAIDRYREGVALLRGCRETLASFQKQVEELGQDAAGGSRPYAGDPDIAAPGVGGPSAGNAAAGNPARGGPARDGAGA
jgi:exodeoxyribonuclease VII small subunit